jgi:transcriptional regulator with XRE-family HTH domain
VRSERAVCAKLRSVRESLGLTRSAVAGKSGIDEGRLTAIELGGAGLTIDELIRLEDVLDLRPGDARRDIRWDQSLMKMWFRPAW